MCLLPTNSSIAGLLRYGTAELHVSEREWAVFDHVVEVLNRPQPEAVADKDGWRAGARDRMIEEAERLV